MKPLPAPPPQRKKKHAQKGVLFGEKKSDASLASQIKSLGREGIDSLFKGAVLACHPRSKAWVERVLPSSFYYRIS